MSNIVNTTIISEGTQKAVIQFYFESDGNEGEFTNRLIFDPSTDFNVPWTQQKDISGYAPVLAAKQMSIMQAWSSTSWFDITLSYDGTVVSPSFVFARDCDFYLDFRYFGGLKDRENQDPTGKLLVSTKDFAPLGSNGFLILEVKKN